MADFSALVHTKARRHRLQQPHNAIKNCGCTREKKICSSGKRFDLAGRVAQFSASRCRVEEARMIGCRRRLVLSCMSSCPRFSSPAAALFHSSQRNKRVAAELISISSSFAIFAPRPMPAVPSRYFVAATGSETTQSRRHALLHAAANFDGEIGSLLLAFTHQVS